MAPQYVGLCGTDLELFSGTMPYFREGTATFPIQPGHEVVASVVSAPDDLILEDEIVVIDPVVGCGRCKQCARGFATRCADRRELGLRNGLDGGAAELVAVPTANLHVVPPGLDPRDAVFVEPGVTALNGVSRFGEVGGESALVLGAGTVGLIAAQLLASRGANVDVLVIDDARSALVRSLGLTAIASVEPAAYECVFEAAGVPAAIRDALAAATPGGRVVLAGVQQSTIVDVDINQIVLKDLAVNGVLNGPGLYTAMLKEIAHGAVNVRLLVDREFRLEEASAAFEHLSMSSRRAPKVLLKIA